MLGQARIRAPQGGERGRDRWEEGAELFHTQWVNEHLWVNTGRGGNDAQARPPPSHFYETSRGGGRRARRGDTTHTHGRSPGAEHGQAGAGGGVVSHSARGPRGRVGEAAPQSERGAVPTRSTHGTRAPPQAPQRQTEQAAHQAAAAAALVYARQKTRGGQCRVLITTSSETAYRNITERGETAGRPAARENRVQRARRAAVNGATARKRQREEN